MAPNTDARRLRNTFAILHNLDKWDLEEAGVITENAAGGSDWDRFNVDIGMFVLKLPTDRLGKLYALIESRQPKPADDLPASEEPT